MSNSVRLRVLASSVREMAPGVDLPYIALEHVESGTGKFLPGFRFEAKVADAEVAFRRGDVLFGKLRPYLAKVIAASFDGCASGEFLVLRPGPLLHARYMYYLCLSRPFLDWAEATSVGTKMPRTDWEALSTLRLRLPPIEEQVRLVDFLDRETARIDSLISMKLQLRKLLIARRRRIAYDLIARLAARNGSIPLKRVVRCLDGRRVPLSAEERTNRRGPYPYYGASEVVDWIDGYLFDEALVLLGEDGAQLADPEFSIAQVVSGKIWVNNHAHVLRPTQADPEYLALVLNSVDRMPFLTGATRPKITQDDMGRIPIPRGSIGEQMTVVKELQARTAADRRGDHLLQEDLELLAERRQALITAAVTGEMMVPAGPA